MRVSFHLSPTGPITFEFDEIEVPVFVDVGLGRYMLFEQAITESHLLDGLFIRISAHLGRLLDDLGVAAGESREARQAGAFAWYLGLLRRRRDTKAVTDEAMRLMGIAVADVGGGDHLILTKQEARARLIANGEDAEALTGGFGLSRVRITDLAIR